MHATPPCPRACLVALRVWLILCHWIPGHHICSASHLPALTTGSLRLSTLPGDYEYGFLSGSCSTGVRIMC